MVAKVVLSATCLAAKVSWAARRVACWVSRVWASRAGLRWVAVGGLLVRLRGSSLGGGTGKEKQKRTLSLDVCEGGECG